jgi:LPS sulfotransferase NodH
MIVGNLENFEIANIRGWLLDTEDPGREFVIVVTINGKITKKIETFIVRDDVRQSYGEPGHGFRIDLSENFSDKFVMIEVSVIGVQFKFAPEKRAFLFGRADSQIRASIWGNEDIYNFPSNLRIEVQPNLPTEVERSNRNYSSSIFGTKIIFVMFTNRSGSNLVTDMLENMGYGRGATNEPLLSSAILENSRKHEFGSVEEYFISTINNWKINNVFFCKISWDALFWLSSAEFFRRILDSAEFIFVKRKDKILQAISFIKANRSRRYFQLVARDATFDTAASKPEEFWTEEKAIFEIADVTHSFHVAEYRLNYFLSINNYNPYTIYYENLAENLNVEYNNLQTYLAPRLGVQPSAATFLPRLQKQASGDEGKIKEIFLHFMSGRKANEL